jgi:hypothetical protein
MRQLTFSVVLLVFINLISFNGLAQIGRVGINTITPLAMLHVKDSNVLFSGAATIPVTPGNPPVSGPGVRMMWYPDKAAFRVGKVNSVNWDKDSIGDYSFASGFNTKAFGNSSIAMGNNTEASESYSTAMGFLTIASGISSTAMGQNAKATGPISSAMGDLTNASGPISTAMGFSTKASGDYSTSMGSSTTATGNISTAMGIGTNSRPFGSLVIGQYNDSVIASSATNWVTTDPVFIIGNGVNLGIRHNAFTVFKNGNMNADGEIYRTATGTANIVPICYGSVALGATINSGTNNFSVSSSATGQYEIAITGETYTNTGYITNVTPVGGANFRVATSGAGGGSIVIRIFDINGTLVNTAFHFVVYKQ